MAEGLRSAEGAGGTQLLYALLHVVCTESLDACMHACITERLQQSACWADRDLGWARQCQQPAGNPPSGGIGCPLTTATWRHTQQQGSRVMHSGRCGGML